MFHNPLSQPRRFVPEGYCTVGGAHFLCVAHWYNEEINGLICSFDVPNIDETVTPNGIPTDVEIEFMDKVSEAIASSALYQRLCHTAYFRLRQALYAGQVDSFFLENDTGVITKLSPRIWATKFADAAQKSEGLLLDDSTRGKLSGIALVDRSQLLFHIQNIILESSQYKSQQLADDNANHLVTSAPLEQNSITIEKDRGGRPARYDDKLFAIEAFKIIIDGVPGTQKELRDKTLDAYVSAGHPGGRPSVDWAKREIRLLWRALNLRDE